MLKNRINIYSHYLKTKYSEKVYRIGLSTGVICPHRIKTGGCIFCMPGTFVGDYQKQQLSVTEQATIIISKIEKKLNVHKFIAYFQDETSTSGNIDDLKRKFKEAIVIDKIEELVISTRPDFINPKIVEMLRSLNIEITLEIGLQTIHNKSLQFLQRGHSFEDFENSLKYLENSGIKIGVHLINGIPVENKKERLETIKYVANNKLISEVKFHHLVVYKDTKLEEISNKQNLKYYTLDEYIFFLGDIFPILRKDQIITRIFTSNVRRSLNAINQFPKTKVYWLNKLEKYLDENNIYQGSNYKNEIMK